ncbi:MAG: hypothetical protein NC418_06410 [Muribaculaceae bacterium]|nr:hypothetical protein [Muribaculaceae bacterium]
MKTFSRNKVAIVVAVVLLLGGLCMAFGLAPRTFVQWWRPAAVCAFIGSLTAVKGWKLMRAVTGIDGLALNFAAAVILMGAVLTGTFYTVNYFAADASTEQECVATVERRYSEERTRSRRVGRRTGPRSEKYTVYILELRLPDSRTFTMQVPADRYVRTRTGAKMKVTLRRGCFGYDVRR